MVPKNGKMIYDINKIEELLHQHEDLPNKEKWELIGAEFFRSGSAAHRWYYRNVVAPKKKGEQEMKVDIPTDIIRTVYLLLKGKSCRIGYYQAITEIQELLEKL
jgi:hypothetical protein